MKKVIALACVAAACAGLNAQAQQLANAGFEEAWGDCIPWTFYGSDDKYGDPAEVVTGTTPADWTISNVSGMCSYYDGESMGLGATVVGEKTDGYDSATAVKLTNTPNPFMAAQIVPAYITLGTTWSTANPGFGATGITVNNSDGGSFGGVEFTGRPKGIEFMYKRSRGTAKPDEKTTIVAYLWKGHWTQQDVPVTIYMAGSPITANMVDRDRCVLGMDMTGCQGGEVTKSDDAELIAVINATITENTDEWTKFTADFDYKSDATPEMINVILASGDYFGGASVVGDGNTLIVDDVKLVYDETETGDAYPGKLTIDMGGSPLTDEPMDATVNILYSGSNSCTLTLPDFTLDLGGGPVNMGNIVVPDVNVVTENGVAKYTGKVDGMSLYEGQIIADVTVNGTIDSAGKADFLINVVWMGIPIDVTFNGEGKPGPGTAAIAAVAADVNAPAEYYTLQGVKVSSARLTPGIYVVRQGGKAYKTVVR